MASSRKSSLAEQVAARLSPLVPDGSSILVGFSGGMDSVVLLHLLHELAPRYQWKITALHVHHGISPNAATWVEFCQSFCVRLDIPLHIERVDITPLRNEYGIEAAARKLRLAAFARQNCDYVALAHHADDQTETLLLQLFRGAGIKGVAAMPLFKPATAHAPATLRPLLDIPRSTLLEYAQQYSLPWVEDESNADDRYPRNFLRHRLLPLLEQRFPVYRDTLSRSAQHFAEASELLDELARQDAMGALESNALNVAALRRLSPMRAKNLLRYFLHIQGIHMPQSKQLEEMLRQLCGTRDDAAVCVRSGDWQVRRYQGRVYALPVLEGLDQNLVLTWSGEAELPWPALHTRLSFGRVAGQGISLAKLQSAAVSLRLRSGGEVLRPHPAAATRSLKNLLQQNNIPPWQRERLPLLYCGDDLACVVGVAIHADYQAHQGEEGVLVSCG